MGSNYPLIGVLIVTLIVNVISKSESKSLYTGCNTKNHFCMGSKNNAGAFQKGGCIQNLDCNIIVHATRTSDKKVTIEIGQVFDSWSYTLFVKDNERVKYVGNVPQQVKMETAHSEGKTVAQTSMGGGKHPVAQQNAYGKGTFDGSYKDDKSKVKYYLFTFTTTTTPPGAGFDFDADDLRPILVRTDKMGTTDRIEGTKMNIFGVDRSKIVPTKPATGSKTTARGPSDKKKTSSFPWWWILVALLLLAILIGIIVCCCCCRKKKSKTEVTEEATASTVETGTPSTSSKSTKTKPAANGASVLKTVVPKSTATGPKSFASAKKSTMSKPGMATKSNVSKSPGKKSVVGGKK